jgi:hypothetical protein
MPSQNMICPLSLMHAPDPAKTDYCYGDLCPLFEPMQKGLVNPSRLTVIEQCAAARAIRKYAWGGCG